MNDRSHITLDTTDEFAQHALWYYAELIQRNVRSSVDLDKACEIKQDLRTAGYEGSGPRATVSIGSEREILLNIEP
jgi:hypothetical protein